MIPPVLLAAPMLRLIGYAIAAAAVLFLIWWAAVVPRLELRDERAQHAATKAACAEMRATWAAELAAAHAKARQQEREMRDTITATVGELNATKAEIRKKDAALAAANSTIGSLRQQRAEYLAAVRVSADPAAASDAATLIAELAGEGDDLLAEGVELLRACAAAADTAVAERDALIRAWPR